MSSLSAAPAEGNTPVLFCVVLFCVVLCCCVWELFFHSRLSFHFFCKRSFDTWSLYFYISIPSLDLLYSRDDLLFVTLSIICFLIAFLIGEVGGAGGGAGGGGWLLLAWVDRLHYVILLLDLAVAISWHRTLFVPVHALNRLLYEASRMNNVDVHIYQRHCWSEYWCWVSAHVWRE